MPGILAMMLPVPRPMRAAHTLRVEGLSKTETGLHDEEGRSICSDPPEGAAAMVKRPVL